MPSKKDLRAAFCVSIIVRDNSSDRSIPIRSIREVKQLLKKAILEVDLELEGKLVVTRCEDFDR